MRIYLINPAFPLSLWDFSLSRDINKHAFPYPPLALPTIAALTPSGHEVSLCDENVENIDFETEADLIGITGYSSQSSRVFEIGDAFRARGKKVVIGGPLVDAATMTACLLHSSTVFMGEAEYTWPQYLEDLKNGAEAPVYHQRDNIDIDDSPRPLFELLKNDSYSTALVETSRGCPYACEFCEVPARLGKKTRNKNLAQVMEEIRTLYGLGARSIYFTDDCFVGNRKRAKLLLFQLGQFVQSVRYAMSFSCQFTINCADDDELLSLFYKANFKLVFIGIETPKKESLLSAGKKQNANVDLVEAVRKIQSYNITVWAGLLIGLDGDGKNVFDDQFAFLGKAGIPIAMIGLLQAIPGTPLYARLEKAQRIKTGETSGLMGSYDRLMSTNIASLHFSEEELIRGFKSHVDKVYDYNHFGGRVIDSIKLSAKSNLRLKKKLGPRELLVLFRIIKYYLNVKHPRRALMFLRVMLYAFLFRPQQVETVLAHLVIHKHFKAFYSLEGKVG